MSNPNQMTPKESGVHFRAVLARARIPMQIDVGFGDVITQESSKSNIPRFWNFQLPYFNPIPKNLCSRSLPALTVFSVILQLSSLSLIFVCQEDAAKTKLPACTQIRSCIKFPGSQERSRRREQPVLLRDADRNRSHGSGQPQAGLMTASNAIYFLSSLASFASFASAIRACWPAPETAFRNAAALLGVVALPERMLRNIMCLP